LIAWLVVATLRGSSGARRRRPAVATNAAATGTQRPRWPRQRARAASRRGPAAHFRPPDSRYPRLARQPLPPEPARVITIANDRLRLTVDLQGGG
jgi:hypothetical protein